MGRNFQCNDRGWLSWDGEYPSRWWRNGQSRWDRVRWLPKQMTVIESEIDQWVALLRKRLGGTKHTVLRNGRMVDMASSQRFVTRQLIVVEMWVYGIVIVMVAKNTIDLESGGVWGLNERKLWGGQSAERQNNFNNLFGSNFSSTWMELFGAMMEASSRKLGWFKDCFQEFGFKKDPTIHLLFAKTDFPKQFPTAPNWSILVFFCP